MAGQSQRPGCSQVQSPGDRHSHNGRPRQRCMQGRGPAEGHEWRRIVGAGARSRLWGILALAVQWCRVSILRGVQSRDSGFGCYAARRRDYCGAHAYGRRHRASV